MKILYLPIILLIFAGHTVFAQTTDTERGIEAYQQKNFSEAIDLFKKAIREEGYDTTTLYYLGSSYENTQNKTEAIRSYILAYQRGLVALEKSLNEAVIEKNQNLSDYVHDKIGTEIKSALKSAERLQELSDDATRNLTKAILIFKHFLESENFKITGEFSKSNENKNLKITEKPPPVFTNEARKNKTSGEIYVYVMFLANGEIGFVIPKNKLPDGLTENAIEAAEKIKFEPAVRNGKPITQIRTVVYNFIY